MNINMKKIVILLVWLALTGITACNNLDLFPPDQLGQGTFWKTERDIQMGITGVYYRLRQDPIDWNRYLLDNITDNGYIWTSAGSVMRTIQFGTIEATTGGLISSVYTSSYRGVTTCNIFLKNFPDAVANAKISETQANAYEAEIRFLRALFYFELVQRYGDIPLYKEALNTVEESMVKQSPSSEVYAFIHEDLDFAIRYLPDVLYSTGHAVKGSAQALKARVALFQSDWNTVESVTKEIINSGRYRLADTYQSIFIKREGQKDNPEIMFSITYTNPDIRQDLEMRTYYQGEMLPMESLMQCYESDDVRFKEWYVYTGDEKSFTNPFGEQVSVENFSPTGWMLLKHMDKYNPATYELTNYTFRTDNDINLLRYADVYLMYIEAMIEKGGGNTMDALALQCMNEIRQRAEISDLSSISRDELRLERRRELAFEGLRHFDLVRWRTAGEVMNSLVTPGGPGKFEDHFYFWPFSQSELDINPNLDQKPGYL